MNGDNDVASQNQALVELVHELRKADYRFTTVTPLTHARVNRRPGNQWATDLPGIFGWSRPFRPSLLPASLWSLMRQANVVETKEPDGARARIRVSTLGEHYFVHSAFPTVEPDAVFFGPDTIRFVRAVRHHLQSGRTAPRRVIDVGCGAGPGGIAIAAAAPQAEVFVVDINALALRYAEVNANSNGVRVQAAYSNVLANTEGQFDLIVSNPPYLIDQSQRAYRHGGGAFGEGLSLEIVRQALLRLSPGGTLLLYTGTAVVGGVDWFAVQCGDLLETERVSWSYEEIDPDVFGEELDVESYKEADRIAVVLLTVTLEAS